MNGKIISVSSVKGGVGKTTILLNLAGIYCELGKRVLIIDMDLFSGGIAISLDIKNTKDIFMLVDSMANNRFTELSKYVTSYNSNIDGPALRGYSFRKSAICRPLFSACRRGRAPRRPALLSVRRRPAPR